MLGEGQRGVQFLNCPLGDGPMKMLLLVLSPKPGECASMLLFFWNFVVPYWEEEDNLLNSGGILSRSGKRKSSPNDIPDSLFLNRVIYTFSSSSFSGYFSWFFSDTPPKEPFFFYFFTCILILFGTSSDSCTLISSSLVCFFLLITLRIFLLLLLTSLSFLFAGARMGAV